MLNSTIETTPALVGFADIQTQAIEGWEDFLHDGEAFLRTGQGAYTKQRKAFTPEILYNIIAMAIEKLVMAALMKHGALPYNHTMGDLVEAMETTFPGCIDSVKDDLLALDQYQEICDIDAFSINPPEAEAIPAMLELTSRLQDLVQRKIKEASS